MPMRYTIDRDAQLVRVMGSGRLTDADMRQCVAALRQDPDLEPDMNTLSDMRGIEVAFTADGIRQVIAIMRRTGDRRSGGRAAIVVDSDVAFGMGRVFATTAEGQTEPPFRIFRAFSDACDWLGIDVEAPDSADDDQHAAGPGVA